MPKIDYESLVQAALRNVIRHVLRETAKNGLEDDHHFLITFSTKHPDVVCPKYLLDENPEEMTIIIQHEFFNLVAEDQYFRVTLNFAEKFESLIVPYKAIVCFVDPSVKFGLHFDDDDEAEIVTQDQEPRQNVISFEDFRKKAPKKKK